MHPINHFLGSSRKRREGRTSVGMESKETGVVGAGGIGHQEKMLVEFGLI